MPATILIIGDHDPMRRALRAWLEMTFPGCRVIESTNGKEATAMIKASSPQVILIDTGLPMRNNWEDLTHLKAIAPATPVVVLTSYEAEVDSTHAIASGARACVSLDRIPELLPALATLLFAWLKEADDGYERITVR